MVCFALFFFFLGLELAGLAPVRPESVCFGSFARVSANRCESGNEKKKNWTGHRRAGSGVACTLPRQTQVRRPFCHVRSSQSSIG